MTGVQTCALPILQAGCDVVALCDAAPRIGGYGVHAAKVARCGVPFYLSHTIVEAEGTDCVTGVTIGQVGPDWKIVPGTEKHFDVDTICLAVGLSPMSQLLSQAGCSMLDTKGGYVPACDADGQTSMPVKNHHEGSYIGDFPPKDDYKKDIYM